MTNEREYSSLSGIPTFFALIVALLGEFTAIILIARSFERDERAFPLIAMVMLFIATIICLAWLFQVQPNQAMVLTMFGKYKGTVRPQGLRSANPFLTKKPVTQRVRNF